LSIEFLTVHASKGLQADYVVVLDVTSGRYGAAFASPVATCYSAAESENPGRSISVWLGTSLQLTTSDLDAAFDEIAEHWGASNLNVTYNTPGRAALRGAMDCILDNGWITLSTATLNQRFNDLQVRTYAVTVRNNLGVVTGRMDFKNYGSTCTAPTLQFEEQDGPGIERAFALGTSSFGAHDAEGEVSDVNGPVGCVSVDCDGECIAECDPDSGATVCFCDGAGDCQEGDVLSITISNTSMAVVQM
jgi:hypothetical protein